MSDDFLGSAEPLRRPRGLGQALAIGTAALAVFVTGTAYATYQQFAPQGHDPEEALPKESYAFAKVDLDPSVEQKLAIYQIGKRFPDLGLKGEESLADDLMRKLFDSAEFDDVDYDTDIKPWIGKRIGIAAVPGKTSPHVAAAVQVTDVEAAIKAIEKDADEDVFVRASDVDDYVIISDDKATADLVADARTSLDDNDDYQHAIDALDGSAVVTGWADLEKSFSDLPEELGDNPFFSDADLSISGQAVMALRAVGDAIELETKVLGLQSGSAFDAFAVGSGEGSGLVQRFPTDAAVAFSSTGLGDSLVKVYEQQSDALAELDSDGLLDALAEGGIQLPADLKTLLGKEVAGFAAGSTDEPVIAVRVEGTSGPKAKQVAQALVTTLSGDSDPAFLDESFLPDAKGFTFGMPREALGGITKGSLGTTAAFKAAVPDAAGSPFVLYIDIPRANTLMELELGKEIAHIQSFGMTSGSSGDVSTMRMRLTFR